MKVSELAKKLQDIVNEIGDFDVVVRGTEDGEWDNFSIYLSKDKFDKDKPVIAIEAV